MSTTKTTQSTGNFNPASMQTYTSFLQSAGAATQNNIQNPFSNSNAVLLQNQANQANSGISASNNAAYANRSNALGISSNSPAYSFGARMNTNASLANTGRTNNNLLLGDLGTRMSSLNSAMNFRPLQTGGTQTSGTYGLGTWLPQVAQAGVQIGGAAYNMMNQGSGNDYSQANQQVNPANNSGSGMYDLNEESPDNLGMSMSQPNLNSFGNPSNMYMSTPGMWGMGAGNVGQDPYGYGSGGSNGWGIGYN
jgi:hypothetical protein